LTADGPRPVCRYEQTLLGRPDMFERCPIGDIADLVCYERGRLKRDQSRRIIAMSEHRTEEEVEAAARPTPTGAQTQLEIERKNPVSLPPTSATGWSSYQITDIAVKILAGLVIATLQIYSHSSEVSSQRELSARTTAVDIVRFYTRDNGKANDSLVSQYDIYRVAPSGNEYPSLTDNELKALKAPTNDEQKEKYNRVRDYLNYVEFVVRSWDNNTADRKILRESYKANFDRVFAYLKPFVDYRQSTDPKSSWGIINCVLKAWNESPQPEFDSSKTCASKQPL
jgi:hypothetical protein